MSRVQVPLSLLPLRVRKALILLAFRFLFASVFFGYSWIQTFLGGYRADLLHCTLLDCQFHNVVIIVSLVHFFRMSHDQSHCCAGQSAVQLRGHCPSQGMNALGIYICFYPSAVHCL